MVTEIPYTMIGTGISKFISDVIDLVETKKTTDIVDISNASDKNGMRIILELKKGSDVEKLKKRKFVFRKRKSQKLPPSEKEKKEPREKKKTPLKKRGFCPGAAPIQKTVDNQANRKSPSFMGSRVGGKTAWARSS
mgnify:CR=1 FL=1